MAATSSFRRWLTLEIPLPPPCDFDRIAVRLGISAGAAVAAPLVAGIDRPADHRRLCGGALVLAIAVAVALRIPLGGPYFPTGHLPPNEHFIGHYGLRNPLRVAIVAVGALIALFIASGNLDPLWLRRKSSVSREATARPTSE